MLHVFSINLIKLVTRKPKTTYFGTERVVILAHRTNQVNEETELGAGYQKRDQPRLPHLKGQSAAVAVAFQ
jgi:hypothetical protein